MFLPYQNVVSSTKKKCSPQSDLPRKSILPKGLSTYYVILFTDKRFRRVTFFLVKEKGSPRVGGARLGETVLNNVGERGGLLRDNARCPIIQSIDIRSCGNLDPITEPQYSISAGYLAES